MSRYKKCSVCLPWIEVPTSWGMYGQVLYPGELYDAVQPEGAEYWVIFGIRLKSSWVKKVTIPILVQERLTWKGRIEEEVK